MGGIPNKRTVDSYHLALVHCHRNIYYSSSQLKISEAAYKDVVERTMYDFNIKGKILKQNFRKIIREGCLLKIE